MKNAEEIKRRIIAVERALYYLELDSHGEDNEEYIWMARAMLSEAMELLDKMEE